jgi:hypothetical protein
LFALFKPVERRTGYSGFAGELVKREVFAPLSEERGQLLCQSFLCHDWMLQLAQSHMWEI